MIKFVLTSFIFLFSTNVVLASNISQFVFSTNPQTIKPNEISEKLTIQAQDANGNSVNVPQTTCLELKTTSTTGEFSSSNTSWTAVNKLTMNKNTANRNFYYKDSALGIYTLTIHASLRPEGETRSCINWPIEEWDIRWTAKQDILVSESVSQPESGSESEIEEQTTTVVVWPVEPQIYANAGTDKTAVVGADVKFSGQALGLEKEPLENARYLWNFGDGSLKEGQNVLHYYNYPGEYIVVLDVSSGKYSASDRSIIKIIPNQLIISEANQNYIKLHNGSSVELDISDWFLRTENNLFKFPVNTFIKANKDLIIDSSVSGFKTENQKAELLYPNSSVAFSFGYPIAENKKDVALIQKPTSDIGSHTGSQQIEEKPTETQIFENKNPTEEIIATSSNQEANIISTTQSNSWSPKKWLMIVLGISILAGGGLILIRRKSSF